jgi:phosphoglycolate phosphatase-like HAD superfamily hydrolase
MHYQAIFFDFDGVILDSVHIKTEAFATMFRPYGPAIEKAVVDYHMNNGGISRYKKFEYFYTQLLNKPIDQEALKSLGQEFERLTLQGVLAAPYISGALQTLKKAQERSIPSFVVSGTPDEEIKMVVEKRNLAHYFWEIHGSPRTKDQIILDISSRYNFNLSNCLFIGDTMTDYQAAKTTGTDFLGIVPKGHESPFPDGTWVLQELALQ